MRPALFALIVAVAPLAGGCSVDPEPAPGEQALPIVNGTLDKGHPAVGLIKENTSSTNYFMCTGTLIGNSTVLTAAHCVDSNPSSVTFTVGGHEYAASKWLAHPGHNGTCMEGDMDLALVFLKKAPSGVKPLPLSRRVPQRGDPVVLVGFGMTAGGANNQGTKRVAANAISSVNRTTFEYRGPGSGTGQICNGDSGGPSLRVDNGQDVVAGVHAWVDVPCLEFGDDMRVDVFVDWIIKNAASDTGLVDKTPPVVSVAAPTDGASTPSDFVVEATASDANSGLAAITLFVDEQQAQTTTSSPATFNVAALAVGSHVLKIEAADRDGNKAEQLVTVTVQKPASLFPPDGSVQADSAVQADSSVQPDGSVQPDDSPSPETTLAAEPGSTIPSRADALVASCALTPAAPVGNSTGPLLLLGLFVLLRRRRR